MGSKDQVANCVIRGLTYEGNMPRDGKFRQTGGRDEIQTRAEGLRKKTKYVEENIDQETVFFFSKGCQPLDMP